MIKDAERNALSLKSFIESLPAVPFVRPIEPEPTKQPEYVTTTTQYDWHPDASKTDDVTLRNILEYLIKIDVKLNKIIKQLKKPNEGKISTE